MSIRSKCTDCGHTYKHLDATALRRLPVGAHSALGVDPDWIRGNTIIKLPTSASFEWAGRVLLRLRGRLRSRLFARVLARSQLVDRPRLLARVLAWSQLMDRRSSNQPTSWRRAISRTVTIAKRNSDSAQLVTLFFLSSFFSLRVWASRPDPLWDVSSLAYRASRACGGVFVRLWWRVFCSFSLYSSLSLSFLRVWASWPDPPWDVSSLTFGASRASGGLCLRLWRWVFCSSLFILLSSGAAPHRGGRWLIFAAQLR